jgi:hypothetical protein
VAKGGYIQQTGITKVTVSGGNSQNGKNLLISREWRGYTSFDTSALLALKTLITKVEFYLYVVSVSSTKPSTWITDFYIGKNVIGDALDNTDWGAAGFNLATSMNWGAGGSPSSQLIDLGSAGINNLNLTGETDIETRDNSLYWAGQNWSFVYANSSRGYLKVTYEENNKKNFIFVGSKKHHCRGGLHGN